MAAAAAVVVAVAVAGERSDILLKHYIVPFARLDNGIGIYRFQYRGNDHTTYVGVMAQEVAKIVQAHSRAATMDTCASTTTRSASSS